MTLYKPYVPTETGVKSRHGLATIHRELCMLAPIDSQSKYDQFLIFLSEIQN